MRIPVSALTMLLSAGLLAAAPAPEKKDPTKEDQEKIQGTWKVESSELGGQKAPAYILKTELKFTGEKVVSKMGDDTQDEGTFKLDASVKVKTIDFRNDDKLVHGIYKLDGDTLTLCLDHSGEARPTEFGSKEGSKVVLIVLKRVKP